MSSTAPPPAAQTTASEPRIAQGPAPVADAEFSLTTQEVRIAVALAGGVSLAVWMGGLARELNLLTRASDGDGVSSADKRGYALYRRLVRLLDVRVSVDLVSGTSAGGINAALLGLANVRRGDLGFLRGMWIREGGFDRLLRDPRDRHPVSLLRGDEQLYPAVRDAILQLGKAVPAAPRETDLFITTTLLSPQARQFTDSFGTICADADHRGLFRFSGAELMRTERIADPLALAARSTASFPAAFEPAFLAYRPGGPNYADITRSHWAVDGGLLVNRPIAPLLQTIFDRPADRVVRRILLHVVPTGTSPAPRDAERDRPPTFAQAMSLDVQAVLSQSIAADLAALREHNDRAAAHADTRFRLARLGLRLRRAGADGPLADRTAWADYRRRQGEWLARPLVAEIQRQLPDTPLPGSDRERRLRAIVIEKITDGWAGETPTAVEAAREAGLLGRSAFDAGKAAVLELLHSGYALTMSDVDCGALTQLGKRVHDAHQLSRNTDLRTFVQRVLPDEDADTIGARAATAYRAAQGDPGRLAQAWETLADVVVSAGPVLTRMIAKSKSAEGSVTGRRLRAAERIHTYLEYFGDDQNQIVMRMLDLHVAERSVLPIGIQVEQSVELVQVSSDTRTALAPGRSVAAVKLTGTRLHQFAGFYKPSWRANDWMWGRIDGAGWLIHLLLDPRRIYARQEEIPAEHRAKHFLDGLAEALDLVVTCEQERDLLDDLAFLRGEAVPMPTSLPRLSIWAAASVQRHIAAEELDFLAQQLAEEGNGIAPSSAAWLASYRDLRGDDRLALLDNIPLVTEELSLRSALLIRTVTRTAAVATAVITGFRPPLRTLRLAFSLARGATRAAAELARRRPSQARKLLAPIIRLFRRRRASP
ncbi:patatin-like protein [Acrocarpospora sp. B8E8]|uniref:patatin-like protein n=1 Tax=Acrocarpospora sp. B8E8 TaxID=3153572 RepID=UPI00325C6047